MNSDDISFPLPDQKYAGKHFIKTSIKKCLNIYNLAEAKKHQISLSTLYRLRPKSVKLKGKIPLRKSCCEKCLNFDNVAKEAFTYLAGTSKDLHDPLSLQWNISKNRMYFMNMSGLWYCQTQAVINCSECC